MNGGEQFNAQQVNRFLREGVLEKTILFLDVYSGSLYGNALAVLQRVLEDERFLDWTIWWSVANADEVQDDLPGDRRDPRVELVRATGLGFLRAIETAQIVVAGPRLPRYYIKNKGQVVVSVLSRDNFQPDPVITQKRAFVQQTLCKTDVLYIEDPSSWEMLNAWFPSGTPFQVVEGEPPRHAVRSTATDSVVLSLSKGILGKTYADMERRFKSVNIICIEHGKTLYMRIPHEKWMEYRDENAPEVLEHVGDDYYPIARDLKNAEVLVTDRLADVTECMTTACSCIFFSNRIGELYELVEEYKDRLTFVGSWDELCEGLKGFLSGEHPTAPNAAGYEAAQAGVGRLLDTALRACAAPWTAETPFKRGDLFISLAILDENVLQALKYYKPARDVSILLTTGLNKDVWNGHLLDERVCLKAKIGLCVPDVAGRYTERIQRNEWRRLLGDCEYETIYAKTTKDALWQKLYQCAPAQKVVMVPSRKILGTVLDGIMAERNNPVLRSRSAAKEPPKPVLIDGKSYYAIGRTEHETYYLDDRGPWFRPALVFVNDETEQEIVAEYLMLFKKRTVFLMDPSGCMKDSEVLEKSNIFWLPIDKLPVKLLLYAESVVQCWDMAVRGIASRMGKKIKRLGTEPLPKRLTDRWALLGITSGDEML